MKKEVKELEEDNDVLRKTNFKNAQYQLSNEADLNARIESLEKEHYEWKKENSRNVKHLEEAELTISELKSKIVSKYKESEKSIKDLKAENHSLKMEIKNILKCDQCEITFDEKELLKQHNVRNDLIEVFKFKCSEST